MPKKKNPKTCFYISTRLDWIRINIILNMVAFRNHCFDGPEKSLYVNKQYVYGHFARVHVVSVGSSVFVCLPTWTCLYVRVCSLLEHICDCVWSLKVLNVSIILVLECFTLTEYHSKGKFLLLLNYILSLQITTINHDSWSWLCFFFFTFHLPTNSVQRIQPLFINYYWYVYSLCVTVWENQLDVAVVEFWQTV